MDLTAFYSAYCRPGMVDLSRSCADALALAPAFEQVPWAAVRPPGGMHELRAAVAGHCYRSLGPEDVLLCSGASEALVACALTLGCRGRPLVALPGSYPSFTETARRIRARRYRSFRRCPNPTCVVATNPSVPGGRRIDVTGVVDRARALDAVPIVDEVHRHIVLDSGATPPAAADLDPLAVSVGDLSKSLGLGGLRVGWIATRNRRLRARIEQVIQLIAGGPSVLADIAALAAFEEFERHVEAQECQARRNAMNVYAVLRDAGWRFAPAQVGLTFVAHPPRPLVPGALRRAREAGFFLVPCTVLDSSAGDSALRISVLADPECLRQALALLCRVGLSA